MNTQAKICQFFYPNLLVLKCTTHANWSLMCTQNQVRFYTKLQQRFFAYSRQNFNFVRTPQTSEWSSIVLHKQNNKLRLFFKIREQNSSISTLCFSKHWGNLLRQHRDRGKLLSDSRKNVCVCKLRYCWDWQSFRILIVLGGKRYVQLPVWMAPL